MLDEEACEKAPSWFVEATMSSRSTGDLDTQRTTSVLLHHIDYPRHAAVDCKRRAFVTPVLLQYVWAVRPIPFYHQVCGVST